MSEKSRETHPGTGPLAAEKQPNESAETCQERHVLESRLGRIRHKILVLSGKGGVGKSTVAVNLAAKLAMLGHRVGLLDVDIHGPSVPRMLGLQGQRTTGDTGSILPVESGGMKVMSIGFLLRGGDDAVIWRGPLKMGVIRQFLKDVAWGDLDYLIVDCPPGTGDEPLSVAQLVPDADGAVIVTTPQELALMDVRKSVSFCRQLNMPIIGVVENMSGFVCPKCGHTTDIFMRGGGSKMATDMGVPYLGSIPVSESVVQSGDDGWPFAGEDPDSPSAKAFEGIVAQVLTKIEDH